MWVPISKEKRAMDELVAKENKTMMMDPTTIDSFTREWWDMRRLEIISRRKQARVKATATVNASVTVSGSVFGGATTDTVLLEHAFFIMVVTIASI
jgi:hypothetical protein